MYRSRRDYHSTGARIMRKLKGKGWIAVATTALALGASIPATILAASPQAIQAVLTSAKSSNFDGKDTLSNDEAIQTESSKALDAITSRWTMNDLDTVKAEITRQKDLGLEAYVVQWGDTLSVIAEAVGKDVQELADVNGISDRDLILTGDILNGVLSAVESVVESQAPAQTDNSNQVTPAQPSKPAPEAPKPVEPKPETDKPVEETPVEEAPDTDKPVEENPDTDKPVEENPDTDKPVEEKPDTDKPVEENPDTDKPVEEEPDTDKPVEENPDTDKPVEEKPDTDKPVEENPDTDKPVEETPTPETPSPETDENESSEVSDEETDETESSEESEESEEETKEPTPEDIEWIEVEIDTVGEGNPDDILKLRYPNYVKFFDEFPGKHIPESFMLDGYEQMHYLKAYISLYVKDLGKYHFVDRDGNVAILPEFREYLYTETEWEEIVKDAASIGLIYDRELGEFVNPDFGLTNDIDQNGDVTILEPDTNTRPVEVAEVRDYTQDEIDGYNLSELAYITGYREIKHHVMGVRETQSGQFINGTPYTLERISESEAVLTYDQFGVIDKLIFIEDGIGQLENKIVEGSTKHPTLIFISDTQDVGYGNLKLGEYFYSTNNIHEEDPSKQYLADLIIDAPVTPPTTEEPNESTPSEETPDESTPSESTPSEETPNESTPSESTPSGETPNESTPSEETPSGETPNESTPSEETPSGETPDESTPETPKPAVEVSREVVDAVYHEVFNGTK